jgi:hypothetical protein
MEAHAIAAGWLTLRPFTAADTGWVPDVSQDPALQRFVQVPSPYQMEHAAFFVHQVAMAGWDGGQRAGFLIEATLRKRLVHRGIRVDAWGRLHAQHRTHQHAPLAPARPERAAAGLTRPLSRTQNYFPRK